MQRPDTEFPWQHVRARTIALVREILADGERAGTWRVEDSELAALILLGGLRAVFRFWAQPRPAGSAERIVEGFLNGFASPTPRSC
jgi:hypothetical protein